jgi:hypothetical protein
MRDAIRRGKRGWVGALALAAALAIPAVVAPAADAAFAITSLSAQPANNNAGANSDFTIGFDVQEPSAQMRNLVIHLPPGLIGNPLATPTCTESKLKADNCSAASDVGDISNTVNVQSIALPVTASGNIYNVVPRQGEPARFGFVLTTPGNVLPPIVLQSPASLRQSDFGLDTTLKNLPRTISVANIPLSIDIAGVDLTLEGKVGSPPQGFLRNPTSCGAHSVAIDATAYNNAAAAAATSFSTDNCAAQPFSPEFSARIHQRSSDPLDPVEMSTTISQTIDEAGLKKAVVTLPEEVIGNGPALANRCSIPDFDAGNCAEGTVVGNATAASPLQAQPLTGSVYLVDPSTLSPFPELGVDLRGGLALKVKGSLSLTPDLQIFVTFDNLPDIPLSEFTLTFADGPDGLNLLSQSACEPPPLVFNAEFLGQSGQTLNTNASPETTCGVGSRKPQATIRLGKLRSGHPRLRLRMRAGVERIAEAQLRLPDGLRLIPGRRLNRLGSVDASDDTPVRIAGHTGRRLTIRIPARGAPALNLRLRRGALTTQGGVTKRELKPFRVVTTDLGTTTTKLSIRAR